MSSLSSIAERFAVWFKHFLDCLDNENHTYEQHLVQGIQLQTWTTKKIKNLTFEQLLVTAIGVNTSWRPFSSGCRIIFCNITFAKEY